MKTRRHAGFREFPISEHPRLPVAVSTHTGGMRGSDAALIPPRARRGTPGRGIVGGLSREGPEGREPCRGSGSPPRPGPDEAESGAGDSRGTLRRADCPWISFLFLISNASMCVGGKANQLYIGAIS